MINPISSNNAAMYKQAQVKSQEGSQESFEQAIEKAMKEKDEKTLRKACGDFEAVFVNMLLQQMKNSIPKSEVLPEGSAGEMFKDMLYEKYSEEAVKTGSIGLADMMYKQLAKKLKAEGEDQNAE